jgi:hypothetical protein
MPRTQGKFSQDTPHSGGMYFSDALSLAPFSTNLVLTRNALGDYSLNRTAAGAESYTITLSTDCIGKRIQAVPPITDFQEAFGNQASQGGNWVPGGAGYPPFAGNPIITNINPPAKGIELIDVFVVYQVGVVSLTSAALSLNRTVFANAAAKTITNIPISATALTLTTNANPYVAVRTVTTPAFETSDLAELTMEFDVTMANTGTLRVYGLGFHYNLNFN